jgi:hypothetical protein
VHRLRKSRCTDVCPTVMVGHPVPASSRDSFSLRMSGTCPAMTVGRTCRWHFRPIVVSVRRLVYCVRHIRNCLLPASWLRLLDQPIELFADVIRLGRGAGENDRLVERGARFLRAAQLQQQRTFRAEEIEVAR